jgi:hypothetical protein
MLVVVMLAGVAVSADSVTELAAIVRATRRRQARRPARTALRDEVKLLGLTIEVGIK